MRPSQSRNDSEPIRWTDRPAASLPKPYAGRLYLPNRGTYVYFNDGSRSIPAREARGIRNVARQFDVTLQGISGDTKIPKGQPFETTPSGTTWGQFMGMGVAYRPQGPIVGENYRKYLDAWGGVTAGTTEAQRGYFDPEIGWVPAEDYEAPPTGGPETPDPNQPNVSPNGDFMSPGYATAQAKFATAKQAAYEDLLRAREREGITDPLTNDEAEALNAEAERRANAELKPYVDGNVDNSPVDNLLDPTQVAEYKPGQFLPQFTGYNDVRRLTTEEADAINYLRSSELDGADSAYAMLLDPAASQETKQGVLDQVTGVMRRDQEQAQTVQDENGFVSFLGSNWNPLTWGPKAFFAGLHGLDVVYQDYVDPSATWAISALPGGPRTATSLEEARTVAPGQMASETFGSWAPLIGGAFTPSFTAFQRGDYLQAGVLGIGAANPTSWPASLAASAAVGAGTGSSDIFNSLTASQLAVAPNTDTSQLMPWVGGNPNEVYNPAYRKTVFEDNPYGSGVSGSIGYSTVVIWDPLNLTGVGKLVRVSHRLGMGAGMLGGPNIVRSERDMRAFRAQLDYGQVQYQGYDAAKRLLIEAKRGGNPVAIEAAERAVTSARKVKNNAVRRPFSGASTLTKFGDWVLDPANGKKRTVRQIMRHSVIKGMPNASEFALALSRVETFEEFALVMRAQAGDLLAVKRIRELNASVADEIEQLTLTRSADNWFTSPDDLQKASRNAQVQTTNAMGEFRRAVGDPNLQEIDPAALADLERLLDPLADGSIASTVDAVRTARALGLMDPAVADKLTHEMDAALAATRQAVFGAPAETWSEAAVAAFKRMEKAIQREKELNSAEIWVSRQEDVDLDVIANRLEELERLDTVFSMTLASEAGLIGNRVNFGIGRAQTLAKWREAARQRRAERQSFQLDTHRAFKGKALPGLVPTVFKAHGVGADGTVTVWGAVRGARAVAADALTRPFTYAAAESPVNFLKLKGMSADGEYREVEAILNSIAMYANPELAGRKDAIFEQYVRMMNDATTPGGEVYRTMEQSILLDMAMHYAKAEELKGDDLVKFIGEIRDVYKIYDKKRADLITQILSPKGGFWVDELGNVHTSPFLESQLIESVPTMDFRMLEPRVRKLAKARSKFGAERIGQRSEVKGRRVKDEQEALLRAKRDLDPAVEANEAAKARVKELEGSEPLTYRRADGTIDKSQGFLGYRGPYKELEEPKELAEARVTLKATEKNRKILQARFDEALKARDEAFAEPTVLRNIGQGVLGVYETFETLWRPAILLRTAYPVRNTIDGTARRFMYDASIVPILQDVARGSKNMALNVVEGKNLRSGKGKNRIAARQLAKMEATQDGKVPKRVGRWANRERERLTLFRDNQLEIARDTQEKVGYLKRVRANMARTAEPSQLDAIDAHIFEIEQNMRSLDAAVATLSKQIGDLERSKPSDLIALYRQGLDRPRKIGDEMIQGVDGRTYWGVRSDPNMGPIMEANASAGETIQSMLGLNLSITRSVMKAGAIAVGGTVAKGNANYMNALTQALNMHVRNSVAGRMWLEGMSVDEIAAVLMDPKAGKKYRDMVTTDRAKGAGRADRARDKDYDRTIKAGADRAALEEQSFLTGGDRVLLATDVDRAHSLITSIDVPGYGRLGTIAELVDDGTTRSIRLTLRDPAIATPGQYSPQGAGWRFAEFERVEPSVAPTEVLDQAPAPVIERGEPGGETFWTKDNFGSYEPVEGEMAWNDLWGADPRSQVQPIPLAGFKAGEPRVHVRRDDLYLGTRNGSLNYLAGTPRDYEPWVIASDPGQFVPYEAVPEVVYHVTVNGPAVRSDGVLRVTRPQASTNNAVGFSDDFPGAVSVTGSFEQAQAMANDMRFIGAVQGRAFSAGGGSGTVEVTLPATWVDDHVARMSDAPENFLLEEVRRTKTTVTLKLDSASYRNMLDDIDYYTNPDALRGEMIADGSRSIVESADRAKKRMEAVEPPGDDPVSDVMELIYDEWAVLAKENFERTGSYSTVKNLNSVKPEALEEIRSTIAASPTAERGWALAQSKYFDLREKAFGLEPPYAVTANRPTLDPANVEIVTINKSQIPPSAATIGQPDDLRIYSDIILGDAPVYRPVEGAPIKTVTKEKVGYLPGTPEVPRVRMEAGSLVDGTNTLAVQALVDAIKGERLGVQVRVLADGKTVSVGLPKVTEELRAQAFDRVYWDNAFREDAFEDLGDGLDLVHDFNRIDNIDDAMIHAEFLVREFERYTGGSEDLRMLLANGPVSKGQIEQVIGKDTTVLPDEIHGSQLLRDAGGSGPGTRLMMGVRKLTDKGFKYMGTMPEDRLVRFPFLARRYEETLKTGTAMLVRDFPDGVPAWAVDQVIQMSRKRALKDVQDYLYTQPRRTNFARRFEPYIPFISAWQNSALAMGKLASTNPETLMYMERAWRAPDQMGMTDQEGNLRIPIPSWMVGKSVRLPGVGKFIGDIPLAGTWGDEWVYDKKSVYVLPQAVDPILSFKSGPMIQMTASTIFQAGFAGPVAPEALRIALDGWLGEGMGQKVWDTVILGTFGFDEFGRDEGYARAAASSDKAFGYNLGLPPWMQKAVSMIAASFGANPGNDNAYAVAYVNIGRDEMLRYLRGERDTEPTAQEIADKANGLFVVRGLSNLTGITGGPLGAITPPQADYEGQELVSLYRLMQDTYGYDQADEMFMSLFGDEVFGLVKSSSTKGVYASTHSMTVAEDYQGLLSTVGPRVKDTGLLNYMFTNGTEKQTDYSPQVRTTQKFRDIPGTQDQLREPLSPEQTIIEQNKSRGWTTWVQFKTAQRAELDARGLTSINSSGAKDLLAEQRAWLSRAENDPLYRDWYGDYRDGFADRNLQARDFLRTLTNDEEWMSDPGTGANPVDMWVTGQQWTEERDQYKRAFDRATTDDSRRYVREQWASRSEEIARTNARFFDFHVRYLDDDDLVSK